MKVTAVVPAAGAGLRISRKKGQRKPFFVVKGKPILVHTLLALKGSKRFNDIVLVVHKDDIARWKGTLERFGLGGIDKIIPGGRTRFESVKKGLSFVDGDCDIVFIHDGVRPLINKKMITDSIDACRRFGAAVCGVAVTSTVKFISGGSFVKTTPDRGRLSLIQTPQVFRKDIILKAYNGKLKDSSRITDDSMLVERLGYKVRVVEGSYDNIKVTTPQDLVLAEELLKERA